MTTLGTFYYFFLNAFHLLLEYIKRRERFEPDAFSMHLHDFEEDKTVALISLSLSNTKVFGPANSTK